ncbi:hypothetical protein DSO57_1037861 [Entomophthora muscae]|uniref:Uncharacterized protein n=1 Tax=Entomophthora muscae TaxID=34485 RepID=A0ACC2RDN3_9FUNG|nr:hypothetical protein DSO57_1037861 [Entomophthora muscae]
MKYLLVFERECGDIINYVAIGAGSLLVVLGLGLLLANTRFKRLAEFVSTSFVTGAVVLGTGSLLHYNMVEASDKIAPALLALVGIVTLVVGLGSGLMVSFIPLLKYLGSFMLGMCGGFSALNLFAFVIHSDVVLLVCSVLMGVIVGWMTHVFKEPMEIVVVPCSGTLLLGLGTMGVLEGALLLTQSVPHAQYISYTVSKFQIIVSLLILLPNIYFHYRAYYLKREQFEVMGSMPSELALPKI